MGRLGWWYSDLYHILNELPIKLSWLHCDLLIIYVQITTIPYL
jgi:hypothetical protein